MRRLVAVALFGALAGCQRSDDAGQAQAAPSAATTPTASVTLHAFDPLERLSKQPALALFRWTQGRDADKPEIPEITVFDDGSVVAWRQHEDRWRFVESTLSAESLAVLLRDVRGSGLLDLASEHSGSDLATHIPETILLFSQGDRWKRVAVSGFLDGEMLSGQTHTPPAAFVSVYRRLVGLALPDAKPWRPRHIMLHWSRVDAPAQPWPEGLPAPGKSTFPPGNDSDVRYVVPIAHQDQALAARDGSAAFALRGAAYVLRRVEPTLEAWTYLERIRFCSASPRACSP